VDILDDMGVSKLSAKVSLKVTYSFKVIIPEMKNLGIFINFLKLHVLGFWLLIQNLSRHLLT